MFTCAEEWKNFEYIEFDQISDAVITILERKPQEISRYFNMKKEKLKTVEPEPPREEPSSSADKPRTTMEVDEQAKLESRLPTVGEDEFEEKMIAGGVEITPESTLKTFKKCVQVAWNWSNWKQGVALAATEERGR